MNPNVSPIPNQKLQRRAQGAFSHIGNGVFSANMSDLEEAGLVLGGTATRDESIVTPCGVVAFSAFTVVKAEDVDIVAAWEFEQSPSFKIQIVND